MVFMSQEKMGPLLFAWKSSKQSEKSCLDNVSTLFFQELWPNTIVTKSKKIGRVGMGESIYRSCSTSVCG